MASLISLASACGGLDTPQDEGVVVSPKSNPNSYDANTDELEDTLGGDIDTNLDDYIVPTYQFNLEVDIQLSANIGCEDFGLSLFRGETDGMGWPGCEMKRGFPGSTWTTLENGLTRVGFSGVWETTENDDFVVKLFYYGSDTDPEIMLIDRFRVFTGHRESDYTTVYEQQPELRLFWHSTESYEVQNGWPLKLGRFRRQVSRDFSRMTWTESDVDGCYSFIDPTTGAFTDDCQPRR